MRKLQSARELSARKHMVGLMSLSPADIKMYVKETKPPFQIYLDVLNGIKETLNVPRCPSLQVVGSDGRVKFRSNERGTPLPARTLNLGLAIASRLSGPQAAR
jgi:hypothetical protein